MNAALDGPDASVAAKPPRAIAAGKRWWWSVRRELWENRSIVVAPVVVAFLVFVVFVIRAVHGAGLQRAGLVAFDGAPSMENPAPLVALLVVATIALVGIFYSADALHGERSDRSILFWKSLPVSDVVSVLAKASIPGVVLPLLAFVVIVVTQAAMYACTLVVNGSDAAGPLLPLLRLMSTVLYGLVVFVLWYAPVHAWLLFVSSWARRLTLGVAIVPWVVASVVERIAFDSGWIGYLLKQRLFGFGPAAFSFGDGAILPNPGRLFASPALWIGLVVAAALLAATVAMRRRMAPI